MASPQQQFSAKTDLSRGPAPQVTPAPPPPGTGKPRGWRYGSSWILLCLVLVFWYVGFGWGDSGGWLWGHRHAAVPVTNSGDLSGTGVAILEVANKQDYIGQSFQVSNVSVDHWSGSRAVWIGSRHSYLPMLLILPSAPSFAPATPGGDTAVAPGSGQSGSSPARVQRLDVSGRIMKAPPLAQAQQQWHLSDEDVNQLEEEGVFIQATSVRLAK